jgi:YD repeat-containing protein
MNMTNARGLVRRAMLGVINETLAWREYRNGADQLIGSIDWRRGETRYQYDAAGRSHQHGTLNGQQPDERFGYDNRDNLTETERLVGGRRRHRTVQIGQSWLATMRLAAASTGSLEGNAARVELGLLDQIARLYIADELIALRIRSVWPEDPQDHRRR